MNKSLLIFYFLLLPALTCCTESTDSDTTEAEEDSGQSSGALSIEMVESTYEIEANLQTSQYKALPSDSSFEVSTPLTLNVGLTLKNFDPDTAVESR